MLSRTAKLVTVPASVTVLCGLAIHVPVQLTAPVQAPVEAVVLAPKPQLSAELPRLIAVDKRIARRLNALRPSVKQRLQRVVGKLPENVTLMVTSATRTRAEQASLRSTFGVKAAPGTSTHEDGRAVDVNVFVDGERVRPRTQNKIIGDAMASEGFRYLGAMDPVHYSIPKEEIDLTLAHGPELAVLTMHELAELQAQAEEQNVALALEGGLTQP